MNYKQLISKAKKEGFKLDRIDKILIKHAQERGDNFRICHCGGIHFWNKGLKAKIIPMRGQACLMIVEKPKGKPRKPSSCYWTNVGNNNV